MHVNIFFGFTMATQTPAETASTEDQEVEAVQRGRLECTTLSMEDSEESEESEAEDDSAAISVDQVRAYRSVHRRLGHKPHTRVGVNRRHHPKNEPYKIMENPPPVLKPGRYWGHEFISTYTGFAKAMTRTDKPMYVYVASGVKFDQRYGGCVVLAKTPSGNWASPARLNVPGRHSYTKWISGLRYIGSPEGKDDWETAIEERLEKRLNALEKGIALDGDGPDRRRNCLNKPPIRPWPPLGTKVILPGASTTMMLPRWYTTI